MTNTLIPPSFLFQYSLAIPRIDEIPRRKGRLLQLDESSQLFVPGCLNGDRATFGLRMGWNPEGLGIQIEVRGKKHSPAGRRNDLKSSDSIMILIDTRHTANVHRATEFCSSLVVLPGDDDADNHCTVAFTEIAQQRALKRDQDGRKCRANTILLADGYTLELWIPSSQLPGFDDAPGIGRMGFYCVIHDTELGEIPLSIGDDFPVAFDPSTWLQLELSQK